MKPVVFAYAGGLESSVAVGRLAKRHRGGVVTVTLDIGQGMGLDDVRERALTSGAVRAHVVDAREEFARDFLMRALAAGLFADGRHELARSLSLPLIAKHLVAIAHVEGARAVAHGSRAADSAARIAAAVCALDPGLTTMAPILDRGISQSDVAASATRLAMAPHSAMHEVHGIERNLWVRSIDPISVAPLSPERLEHLYALTRPRSAAADIPAHVQVEFDRGLPIAINGVVMSLVDLFASLETIAGAHAVGRFEPRRESSPKGMGHVPLEAPAALVLQTAYGALQQSAMSGVDDAPRQEFARAYADLLEGGLWYSPAHEAADKVIGIGQRKITGTIGLKIFQGRCEVLDGRDPFEVPGQREQPSARVAQPVAGVGT
jgi:argininosuccinate synthase